MLNLTQLKCPDGKYLNAIYLSNKKLGKDDHSGNCQVCNETLYCPGWQIEDCWGCAFVCPKCDTHMFLNPKQIYPHGYGKNTMALDLPTITEKINFGFPENNPVKE